MSLTKTEPRISRPWRILGLVVGVGAALVVAGAMFLFGFLRFNYPSHDRYPVRGMDVSHHQGQIDWGRLPGNGINFAYMKASEGTDLRDSRFQKNWAGAQAAGILPGAYHFFTFCTPGDAQADNFIEAVSRDVEMLPPAIDIEFDGNCTSWSDLNDVKRELGIFVKRVEEAFAIRPVLYVTAASYRRIVAGDYSGYDLWARSIFRTPRYSGENGWLLWQFADRGRLPGIDGFVDLNVFRGTEPELMARVRPADIVQEVETAE